jgi:hypothetical protein
MLVREESDGGVVLYNSAKTVPKHTTPKDVWEIPVSLIIPYRGTKTATSAVNFTKNSWNTSQQEKRPHCNRLGEKHMCTNQKKRCEEE